MKHTHFRCMSCRIILPVETLVNKTWAGWNAKGETLKVDNYTCPSCGSNNLTMRIPGADKKEGS